MSVRRSAGLGAAATAVWLTSLATPAVEAQSSGIFRSVDQTPPSSGRLADMTLRSRLVRIDLGQLARAQALVAELAGPTVQPEDTSSRSVTRAAEPEQGATLTLNLFDDAVVTGLVEWTEPTFSGGYSVSGRLVDEPLGTMTLVVNGERVVGSVRTLDGTYRIRSVGEGVYAVSEVEEPPLRCGVEGPHPETADHRH